MQTGTNWKHQTPISPMNPLQLPQSAEPLFTSQMGATLPLLTPTKSSSATPSAWNHSCESTSFHTTNTNPSVAQSNVNLNTNMKTNMNARGGSAQKPVPDQFTIWMPTPVIPSLATPTNLTTIEGQQQLQLLQQQILQQQLQHLQQLNRIQPMTAWNMNALNQNPAMNAMQKKPNPGGIGKNQQNPSPRVPRCIPVTPSSVADTVKRKTRVEKIFLNKRGVTNDVWDHLSKELPALQREKVSYDAFYVASNRPAKRKGSEWDLILKVWYKNELNKTSHIKYYLVHQQMCLSGNRCSEAMIAKARNGCIQIELEMPFVLFQEFDHIVSYMYGNEIYVGDSHLIELFVLMDRLKMNGGVLQELQYEIRKFCDKDRCVRYLKKAESLHCEHLIWLCGDSILQNLAQIKNSEWLTISVPSFLLLIHQAVSGGIEKYSDFVVCELMVQYLKAIMSESHPKAKDVVGRMLVTVTPEITSVSLEHALLLIKVCDVLFADEVHQWRVDHIPIYRLAMRRISNDFTPYHSELCQQLQGLSPLTFSKILVAADHLKEAALIVALMEYKGGNHAAYYNDRHLRVSYILRQRNVRNNSVRTKALSPSTKHIEQQLEECLQGLDIPAEIALQKMDDDLLMATMASPLDLMNHNSRSGTRSPSKSPPDYSTSYSQHSDYTPICDESSPLMSTKIRRRDRSKNASTNEVETVLRNLTF